MRSYAQVTFNPPKAHTLCGQAWAYFAAKAEANTPVTSKQLPAIAAETGFNLGNLKIELSRYNRYTESKLGGTLGTAPAKAAAKPATDIIAARLYMEQQQNELRAATAAAAPMLLLPAPAPAATEAPAPAKHSKHGKRTAH